MAVPPWGTVGHSGGVTETATTAKAIAAAAGIGPRTKRFVLRDADGLAYDGDRTEHVLAALCRSDRTELPTVVHYTAYAIYKCLVTARMNPALVSKVRAYSPYQICKLVAHVAGVAGELSVGELADTWINAHAGEL